MVALGVLPGFTDSGAHDINGLGEVVGYCAAAGVSNRGFRWTSGGGMQAMGTLPGGVSSDAVGINDQGLIVGTSDTGNPNNPHAVLWNAAGVPQDLGVLPGGTWSSAFGLNTAQTVVGNGNNAASASHAFVWTAQNGMRDLNSMIPVSGWMLQQALAINTAGQVVGVGTLRGNQHAFLLTPHS